MPDVQRSDVQRNRDALLQAARELFATSADVPMYEVAKRAGVGQATLYRHFPDRHLLARAVADELIDELTAITERTADDPDAFVVLLRSVARTAAGSGGLGALLHQAPDAESPLRHVRDRLIQLLAEPLRRAQAAGAVRPDVGDQDILLIISMVHGGLRGGSGIAQPDQARAERATDILLAGLRPRSLPSSDAG